jgi:hypothetical protein
MVHRPQAWRWLRAANFRLHRGQVQSFAGFMKRPMLVGAAAASSP